MGVPVDNTYKSLENMWKSALARRCDVLALTVPETAGNFPLVTAKRTDLNRRILGFQADN